MPRELPSPGQIGPDHQSTTLLEDTLRRLLCEGFTSTLGVAAAKDKGKAVRIAVASPDCNVVSHCILPSLAHALAQIKAVLTEEIFIWSEDKSQAPNTELQAPNTGSLALMPKDTSRDDMAARAMRLARRGLAAAAAEPARKRPFTSRFDTDSPNCTHGLRLTLFDHFHAQWGWNVTKTRV